MPDFYEVIIKKVLALLLCNASFFIACAQYADYSFENITSAQGLADIDINAIIQDKEGYIWIGSGEGLTKYNGYSCKVYKHSNDDKHSLSDNEVYALCIDDKGFLWIGTRNGLNRYDAVNDRFDNYFHNASDSNSLASNEVFALCKDRKGNIWIGTYGGGLDMLTTDEQANKNKSAKYHFLHHVYNEKDKSSISDNKIYTVCADRENRIWAGTTNGLNILDTETKSFTRLYHQDGNNNSITSNIPVKVFASDDGPVWICGVAMLDKIEFSSNTQTANIQVTHFLPGITLASHLQDWVINDFFIDHAGHAWLATNDSGLIKFTISTHEKPIGIERFVSTPGVAYSLVNSIIFNLFEDHSGVIWIGTSKGISKYIPSKKVFSESAFQHQFLNRDKRIVQALATDVQNRLWIASDNDSIYIIDETRRSTLKLNTPLSNTTDFEQVNTLFRSSNGDMYAGTFRKGLYIIPAGTKIADKKNWKLLNTALSPGLPSNNIYSLAENTDGTIWIGTYTGLCMYRPVTGKLHPVYVSPDGSAISDYIIRTICTDDKNRVWCGTDNGLFVFNKGKLIKSYKSNETDTGSLTNNRITFLFKDSEKNIWVGTKEGLNLFKPGTDNFSRFTNKNGLPDNSIRSILQDEKENLWIGASHGLIKFNIQENKFFTYSIPDGLISDQFEALAAAKDANGILYFGTNSGIVSFKPENIQPNVYVPPVVITNINIFDQSLFSLPDTAMVNTYRNYKKLVLRYDQNFFSFEFASLNYINSTANQYAYMLEGVDRQWNNTGTQRFAGYTDIKPGHYIFKVKGSNNDGIWNNEPVIIEVIITPPWWKTWWFYTLCFIAFCALLYLIYHIRLRQILKLYRLRSSIAKDLHDDVGSALSSIALLSRIAKEGKTNARMQPAEIFSRIDDTSKRMIDLMDDIVWSVNPDNDRFSNMLVRMREYAAEMLEAKNIDFSFTTGDDIDELKIPMQMRKDYFLIFKEGVNNLAKYANCTEAAIAIQKQGRNIITTVKDNGQGFDAAIINSGNGLKNMQSRAATLKGKIEIETAEGKGTCITLTIPV